MLMDYDISGKSYLNGLVSEIATDGADPDGVRILRVAASGNDEELGLAGGSSLATASGAFIRLSGESDANAGRALIRAGDSGEVNIGNSGAGAPLRTTSSNLGFYGAAPAAKPTVTGSRAGNAALADLLTELATLGLITDSSS
jgi:hypothetical protein